MAKDSQEIRQLALNVQLSIAKLAPLQETMKLVSELCEGITGIAYPINIEESRKTHLQERQKKTERNIASEKPKRKRGRPKGSKNRKSANDPLRKQINAAFRKSEEKK